MDETYQETMASICELVIRRKLDATDLKIIAARDSSPLPSMRDVAIQIGIDVANVSRRMRRIQKIIKDENKNLYFNR